MSDTNLSMNLGAGAERPAFPKRAVITGGMPYGNKELHFGHIGGVFAHADTYARFLRDRIGKENVIFVSGTDCYGSPIQENYRQLVAAGKFQGTIEDFVRQNHLKQKETLDRYGIGINLFAASGLGRAAEIHREVSETIITTLYRNGYLKKLTTSQFYDPDAGVFLNGRQVVGQCPIAGCQSEKGYADECSLGHQYMPVDLINPVSTLSGKKPEMRDVTNWYFDLERFQELLVRWVDEFEGHGAARTFAVKNIREFLEPPVIYIKRELMTEVGQLKLPDYVVRDDPAKQSVSVEFKNLAEREDACAALAAANIRFRTGKTLVPFRLTGNIDWGVPAPALEGLDGLTVWVWPESLWAPISFTMAYLESQGKDKETWKDWWCSGDAGVYQFIGVDNVYFYGPVEMAMFMGMQGGDPKVDAPDGALRLPDLVVNNHILFFDKKASSSGAVKPPMAADLLEYYTAEQLRAHFLGLGLSIRSVGFQPKPLNPNADPRDNDPVLKEGSLLTNVLNRAVRSCFYTAQKYTGGKIPVGAVSPDVLEATRSAALEYERLMSRFEFHMVMNLLDTFIRDINKRWASAIKTAEDNDDQAMREQVLIDSFHMVRMAAVLVHPIAPDGAEMIREYLNLGEEFWNWSHIFDTVYDFMADPASHEIKFLEPRVDFFKKHESQLK